MRSVPRRIFNPEPITLDLGEQQLEEHVLANDKLQFCTNCFLLKNRELFEPTGSVCADCRE